jgi:hypothetical protein
MRRFRVVRGGLTDSHHAPTKRGGETGDPALTRGLRSVYAPPSDGYWDGLEATIMAAVRVGRAAPATAVEWWQTLARWARPGIAAAAVMLVVVGGVALQTLGPRSDARASGLLDVPAAAIMPMDEEFARALDAWGDSVSPRRRADARAAADLLTAGAKRRQNVRLDFEATVPGDGIEIPHDLPASEPLGSPRAATPRHAMP